MIIRKLIGLLSRILMPNYSTCGCCGMAWGWTSGHTTTYTKWAGCFPLCEHCWTRLTPLERLPYYQQLWREWVADSPHDLDTILQWVFIESAVREGK